MTLYTIKLLTNEHINDLNSIQIVDESSFKAKLNS